MEMLENRSKIAPLLLKLHEGFEWMEKNADKPEKCEALIKRAEPMIKDLERLGVERAISESWLIYGASRLYLQVKEVNHDLQ